MYFLLDPHVAGELGPGTALDASVHPPQVAALEYVFDGPEPDDLVQSFPVHLVSEPAAERMSRADLSGYVLDRARVRLSPDDTSVAGAGDMERYRWLVVRGRPQVDDLWLTESAELCVSPRAMAALEGLKLARCDVARVPEI